MEGLTFSKSGVEGVTAVRAFSTKNGIGSRPQHYGVADVGGGSVSDSTKLSLSQITLFWMVREVILAKAPIEFDSAAIRRANIPRSIFDLTSEGADFV